MTAVLGTRLLVTYVRKGNRCVLPCWFVEERPNGDLVVDVDRVDQRTQMLVSSRTRTLLKEELVSVEEVTG